MRVMIRALLLRGCHGMVIDREEIQGRDMIIPARLPGIAARDTNYDTKHAGHLALKLDDR